MCSVGLKISRLRGDATVGLARSVTRCHTYVMPTKRRRHAITETPPVHAALEALRHEAGNDRLDMGELVILGANEKLARMHAERASVVASRRQLADRIRNRDPQADIGAAEEVRRSGWARP